MNRSVKSCLLFGVLPFIYYVFDYAVVIYSDLMYSGNRAVVQFLPSFMSAFYLAFVLLYNAETQKQASLQRDHDMLDMQFRLVQNEFASLRQMQENAAAYRHDMRHHLAVIQGLASSETELREYLRTAISDMDAITPVRFCNNETVNLILSAYAGKAKQAGITLTIEAKLPDTLPFSDTEVCSLLSNGLENAVHACKNIPESNERSINLRIYSKDDRLVIDIRNSYQTEPVFDQGLPVSNVSRNEVSSAQGHGFGTKSMAHIVEKHGGVFRFQVKDELFVFQATI
jgi:sensor histidine kinase regulating citrate/malate metabolism